MYMYEDYYYSGEISTCAVVTAEVFNCCLQAGEEEEFLVETTEVVEGVWVQVSEQLCNA